ncbi:oligosaccharide flippase family protein [uncultured Ilyobacter sp.]|uniref:oligosaccharide flippase family protein n=1 Tax=uncultured Ilyobacter sp. TaxID=544433 RepID=UPI0029F50749|nr:oligosaccharide flippase family protein [uncultured Ilyobacter sp.]
MKFNLFKFFITSNLVSIKKPNITRINPVKKSLIASLIENIIKFFLSFTISIFIAKKLGPTKFGEYNYYLTILSLIYSFSLFGLDSLLPKLLVINKEIKEKAEWLFTGILFQAFVIAIEVFILFLLRNKLSLNSMFFLVAISYIVKSFENIKYYNLANRLGYINSKLQMITIIFSSVLKMIYLYVYSDLNVLLLIILLTELLRNFLFITQIRLNFKIVFIKKKFIFILKQGFPLFISALSVNLYMRIDQLMIKNMLNNTELGIYSVAVRLTEIWYLIPGMIIPIFFPLIIKYKDNKKEYEDRIIGLISILILISIVLIIPLILFSELIVNTLYGLEYLKSGYILKYYSFLIFITFLGAFRGKYLVLENKQKYLIIFGIFGLGTNIILNYTLIPSYQSLGATFASIISQLMTNIFILFIFKETREIGKMQFKALFTIFKFKTHLEKLEI